MATQNIENSPGDAEMAHQLVQSARAGSQDAFGELTERCRRYLLHVARRELNGDLRAKVAPSDLVQQTVIQAQRVLRSFQGETEEEFQAWLRQILLNYALGAARFFQNTAKRDVHREVPLEVVEIEGGQTLPVNNAETPSKLAVRNERMGRMALALDRLTPLYREVVELRSLKLQSFAEIGEQLSRTPEAARSLWIRAMERLRTEMQCHDESW
jgi:RNA polymerase sigma-70 factor (ECF subfamily)